MPLSIRRVDAGRVVSADVEHNDGVILGGLEILLQAIEVETLGLGRIVAILLPVVADKASDSPVDGPCRRRDKEIDVLVRVPLAEESETKAERASTRDRLGSGDAAFLKSSTVLTVAKLEALLDVAVETADGQVLVVHLSVKDDLLGAADAREDVWLAIIILVGAHAEEDLLRVSFLLEGIIETKDGVSRGCSEASPGREGGSALGDEIALSAGNKTSEHDMRCKIRFKLK